MFNPPVNPGDYLGAAIAVALCAVFWLPWCFIGPQRLALHWRRLREAPRK